MELGSRVWGSLVKGILANLLIANVEYGTGGELEKSQFLENLRQQDGSVWHLMGIRKGSARLGFVGT